MADVLGEAVIRVRSDTSGFESSTRSSVLGTVAKVGGAAAGLFAGFKIFDFVKDSVIGFNSTLEQSHAAFQNLLGSGQAANKMLADLQNFAKTTPFAFEQLIPVAQQLVGALGKGVDVTAVMTNLGDAISATGGSADKLSQLTLAYTQLATSGTAHLGDLMQINNAVPGALARMAAAAGVSVGTFRENVSKGLVSSGDAVKLFHKITTDPKFGIAGGMEAQSKTFAGAVSNIGDALQQGLAAAGKPVFGFVSSVAKGFAGFLAILQDTGSVFGSEMDQFFGQFGTTGVIMLATIRGIVIGFGLLKDAVSLAFAAIGAAASVIQQNGDTIRAVFGALLAAVQAAIPPIQSMFNFITEHSAIFGPLAIGIGIATAALLGLAAAMVVGTAVATAFGAALALAFSPIVIIVVTIGLLIGAVILLYRNSQTARDIIDGAWAAIRTIVTTTISVVRSTITGFVATAQALWQRFGGLITTLTINAFNTIKGVVSGALSIIKGILNVFIGLFTGDWTRMWTGVKQIASGALGVLRSIISGAIGALGAVARSLGQAILNGIVDIVRQIPGKVGALIRQIPGAIGNVSTLLYNAGVSIAQGLLNGLKAGFNAVKDEVSGWGSSIASLKGPLDVDRVLLTPAGQAIVQGLHEGLAKSFPKVEQLVGDFAGRIASAATVAGTLGTAGGPLVAAQAQPRAVPLPALAGALGADQAGIIINGDVVVRAEHPRQFADALNAAAERAR